MVGRRADRQREDRRPARSSAARLSPLSLPSGPLLSPGHVVRPAQEVEARGAGAGDPAWDGRRRRRRSESSVIFSFSSLQGLS